MVMRFAVRAARLALGIAALAATVLLAGCGESALPVAPTPDTPLQSLTLNLATDTLQTGGTRLLVAVAVDTSGNTLSNPPIHWSSSDAAVASVNSSGLVTAAGEGVAWIRALYGGKADSVRVFVYAATGWVVQGSGTSSNLNGVCFRPDGRKGWAVGDAGTILRTTNAGGSWTASSPTTFALNGVWFTSDTKGWAVGAGGTVMLTTDAGVSWSRLANIPSSDALMDVCFPTALYGWAVGDNGTILRTRDGGVTWEKKNPTAVQLQSVSFADTSNGWAVGDNGVILGTRDAGASWFVTPSITAQSLRGVWRLSSTSAWAAGQQGVTPRTSLVTATPADTVGWQLDNAGGANQLEGVCFPTANAGWVVGFNGGGIIMKSTNGGSTWNTQVSNSAQRLLDVWFVDDQRGWAVGVGGRIVHTGRGGE